MTRLQSWRLFPFAVVVVTIVASSVIHAQNYSVLYDFGRDSNDPSFPHYSGIVAQGRDGNLYTTAARGGAFGHGAVFKLTPKGELSVLYSFEGSSDGSGPASGLTLGTDGNFYGTTTGGLSAATVFKITPRGTITTLYTFTDGSQPFAPPVEGTDGDFYGTTPNGGNAICFQDMPCGIAYKITPAGKFTKLYSFHYKHGFQPYGPLVVGADGNFWGTTMYGGTGRGQGGYGVVFKMTVTGKLSVIYNFDSTHGQNPYAGLVQGKDGNFYGTAAGGTGCSFDCGVVFRMTPTGKVTVLHNMNDTLDGYFPIAGLVDGTDGNFYGGNWMGGEPYNAGTLFKVTQHGEYTVVLNFDYTDGDQPLPTALQHTNGIIYGETFSGGTGDVYPCYSETCGVFYSLNLGLKPFVSLLPYSGKTGKTIGFLGQGFKGTNSVSFNGTAANFEVVSDTYLTAIVPNGATTGFVTVTTNDENITSKKKFHVIH
jgi:uncharacterized repeat protein (TIGR03803 family)